MRDFIIISSIIFNNHVQANLQGKPDTVQFTIGILTICLLNQFDQFFLIGRAIIVERLYGSEKPRSRMLVSGELGDCVNMVRFRPISSTASLNSMSSSRMCDLAPSCCNWILVLRVGHFSFTAGRNFLI